MLNHRPSGAPAAGVCESVRVTLPPEPRSGPLAQTLRWAFRPLPSCRNCREKLGDSFSVNFLGFERPMVLISDPRRSKLSTWSASTDCRRAATYSSSRSSAPARCCCSKVPTHLATPQADAAVLSRRADALLRVDRRRDRRCRDRSVAARRGVRDPSSDAGDHPRGDPRVVFGVASGPRLEQLRDRLGRLLVETSSPVTQLLVLAIRRFGNRYPLAKIEEGMKEVDELLYAEIAEHRVGTTSSSATTCSRR